MPLSKIWIAFSISILFVLAPLNLCLAESEEADFSNENCLSCHGEVGLYFSESVHSDLSCMACHPSISSDHLAESDVRGMPETTLVSPLNVPETCGACHNQELNSYMDSVHGRGLLLGTVSTANCIDCHGSHNALAVSDPDSTASVENLPETCGKCHEADRVNYAAGTEHQSYKDAGTSQYYTFKFFVWLTILTVIGLILHMEVELLYLFKKAGRQN